MGLFSASYETAVGTSVSRVINDDSLPDSILAGSIRALFENGDFSDYVNEELVASVGVRAERMYNYGEAHYVHGLPSGEVFSDTQGRTEVEAIIEAAEGRQVNLVYSHFGPPNSLHIGWLKLVNSYGYKASTNQIDSLTTVKGFPVYLKDMVVVVPVSQVATIEPGVLTQWGIGAAAGETPERPVVAISSLAGPSPIFNSSTATEIHVKVTYVWKIANGTLMQEDMILSVSEYDKLGDYFHAKYTYGTTTKYWMYKYKAGTYPSLDSLFNTGSVVSGEYFPFAYFRYAKHSVISDTTTDAYKTSKKLVKFLGIDFDAMATTIDENPDIADVEQAMLVLAVPAVSTNQLECRYLYQYFDNLYYAMEGENYSALQQIEASINKTPAAKNSIVIKDALFKMALTNTGIFKKIIAGTIGDIGFYTTEHTTTDYVVEYVHPDTYATTPTTYKIHHNFYRKQIAVGLYEEIEVVDLKMTYFIFNEHTTIGTGSNDFLLIPLDRSITKDYSLPDKETLYARSLHFVFNSRVVTKVEWYQTGIFQAFMVIVAVAITIYTYGADGGSLVASVLGLTGTAGLVATVIVNLAIGKLLGMGFKLFVKVFGTEVATLIAVVAAVSGAYRMIDAGSIAGVPWAQELLSVANGLQQAIMGEKFADLAAEATEFKLFVEEQEKLLEEANKLLEQKSVLSPFIIIGEKPKDFYNRTVHSGNIGVLGINAIHHYADIALTLPTLNDTLGEPYDRSS